MQKTIERHETPREGRRRRSAGIAITSGLGLVLIWALAALPGWLPGRSAAEPAATASDTGRGETDDMPASPWQASPSTLYLPRLDGGGRGPIRVPSATLPPSPEPTLAANLPSPTWPVPTATPGPLPSGTPEGWQDWPPPARLVVPGFGEQEAGVAPHCWLPSGLCWEWDGVPTPLDAMQVSGPFGGRLFHQPIEIPKTHRLTVRSIDEAVDIEDMLGWRWWSFDRPEDRHYDLLRQREQDIQIGREPGRYVLDVYIAWEDLGDVHYGFLVEVRP